METRRLKRDLPSLQRDGYVHPAGTPVVLLEGLGPEVWVAEIHVPESPGSSESGWWETFDVHESELERILPSE